MKHCKVCNKKALNTTGSLTLKQAKELLKNPPENLHADIKDLLDTMRKVERSKK